MRILKLQHTIASDILKQKMKTASNMSDFKRYQILYLISTSKVDASYLSDITGYSKANIYTIVQAFNNSEDGNICVQKRGGRRRSLMSIEEEKSLMNKLEKQAVKGQILNYLSVKDEVEKTVGKKVSDDYIWDLFKRNNWTKHSPRPHHPKKDIAKQNEFKKNSKTIWLPPQMISE